MCVAYGDHFICEHPMVAKCISLIQNDEFLSILSENKKGHLKSERFPLKRMRVVGTNISIWWRCTLHTQRVNDSEFYPDQHLNNIYDMIVGFWKLRRKCAFFR